MRGDPSRSTATRCCALLTAMAMGLTGCVTHWSPSYYQGPPPRAEAYRFTIYGQERFLEVNPATLEGDTALSWVPSAENLRNIPPAYDSVYMAGRVPLTSVETIWIPDGKECGGRCKAAIIIVGVAGLVVWGAANADFGIAAPKGFGGFLTQPY